MLFKMFRLFYSHVWVSHVMWRGWFLCSASTVRMMLIDTFVLNMKQLECVYVKLCAAACLMSVIMCLCGGILRNTISQILLLQIVWNLACVFRNGRFNNYMRFSVSKWNYGGDPGFDSEFDVKNEQFVHVILRHTNLCHMKIYQLFLKM